MAVAGPGAAPAHRTGANAVGGARRRCGHEFTDRGRTTRERIGGRRVGTTRGDGSGRGGSTVLARRGARLERVGARAADGRRGDRVEVRARVLGPFVLSG